MHAIDKTNESAPIRTHYNHSVSFKDKWAKRQNIKMQKPQKDPQRRVLTEKKKIIKKK